MKSISLITLFVITLALFQSCGKFVEGFDESPNDPVTSEISLILSAAEMGLQTSYTTGIARVTSILMQQVAGTQQQMLEIAAYTLREGDNLNEWNTIYNNVVQPCNDIIEKAGDENPHYAGIAKIIKAMAIGLATDIWGDVPASEAGYGKINGILSPAFEHQDTVLNYIQQLLNEGISDLNIAEDKSINLPGDDDFLLNGDIGSWINTANVLKARYFNRLSKKTPVASADSVLKYTDLITADYIGLSAQFGSGTSEINQWWAFENARADYIKAGKFFVDTLIGLNDPRLTYYIGKDTANGFSGSAVNEEDIFASPLGPYIISRIAPIPIITPAEIGFIKAEANLRLSKNTEASDAFNKAVKDAIIQVTGKEDTTYFKNYASETEATINMEKVMLQKYLAMIINIEVWSDWRRTGIPALKPNPDSPVAGIPRRLPTVTDERTYNPNAIRVTDILKPVWWDE